MGVLLSKNEVETSGLVSDTGAQYGSERLQGSPQSRPRKLAKEAEITQL